MRSACDAHKKLKPKGKNMKKKQPNQQDRKNCANKKARALDLWICFYIEYSSHVLDCIKFHFRPLNK